MGRRILGGSAAAAMVSAVTAVGLVRLINHRTTLAVDELARMTLACERATARAVQRELAFITVKRTNPRFLHSYGHWWIEIDDVESYGWWADRCPIGVRELLIGTRGCLNGVGGTCGGGTPTRDPHHGDPADHEFHPTLIAAKSDDQVRADIRSFAQTYRGWWRYSMTSRRSGCHEFQLALFDAAGVVEQPKHFHTRGPGCPFLLPLRRTMWWWEQVRTTQAGRAS